MPKRPSGTLQLDVRNGETAPHCELELVAHAAPYVRGDLGRGLGHGKEPRCRGKVAARIVDAGDLERDQAFPRFQCRLGDAAVGKLTQGVAPGEERCAGLIVKRSSERSAETK